MDLYSSEALTSLSLSSITLLHSLPEVSIYEGIPISQPTSSFLIHISPVHHSVLQSAVKDRGDEVQHCNLLRLKADVTEQIGENAYRIVVQEHSGTPLYDEIALRRKQLQPYREPELKSFLGQLSSALLHLQSLHRSHRCICPFSIYVCGKVPKLGYFCTPRRCAESYQSDSGTKTVRSCTCQDNEQSNVFSLGMTAIEMALVSCTPHRLPVSPTIADTLQLLPLLPYSPSFTSLLRDTLHRPSLSLSDLILKLSEAAIEYIHISEVSEDQQLPENASSHASRLIQVRNCVNCHTHFCKLAFHTCLHGVCEDKCRRELRKKLNKGLECPECGVKLHDSFFDEDEKLCCTRKNCCEIV